MPTLVRRLGLWSSIGIVIGITIGGGIFRTPAGIATRVPDPFWMMSVWVVGGLVVFGGALAFGIVDALQLRIQAASGGTSAAVPYEVFQALPYVLTLVVMVTATAAMRRSAQPSALGIPFRKGVSE